jgi:hypothetical protein
MTLKSKLVIGSILGIGIVVLRRRRTRRVTSRVDEIDDMAIHAGDAIGDPSPATVAAVADRDGDITLPIGLSEVDPEPLTYVVEAVDPDAVQAAHDEMTTLRERLPMPGKSLP